MSQSLSQNMIKQENWALQEQISIYSPSVSLVLQMESREYQSRAHMHNNQVMILQKPQGEEEICEEKVS